RLAGALEKHDAVAGVAARRVLILRQRLGTDRVGRHLIGRILRLLRGLACCLGSVRHLRRRLGGGGASGLVGCGLSLCNDGERDGRTQCARPSTKESTEGHSRSVAPNTRPQRQTKNRVHGWLLPRNEGVERPPGSCKSLARRWCLRPPAFGLAGRLTLTAPRSASPLSVSG